MNNKKHYFLALTIAGEPKVFAHFDTKAETRVALEGCPPTTRIYEAVEISQLEELDDENQI